ncbi:MAG: transposase [Sporichthyaceae bacterium]|nr:transposase [Sporichthyaceae bacterium]
MAVQRTPQPTAAIIDSQTVRGADTVAADTAGYDAGKKIKGRKRHIATDSTRLLLAVVVTAASVQDRDAAHRLLAAVRARFSTVQLVWADGGHTGRLVTWAKTVLALTVQIVKRSDAVTGLEVLPHRWVVGGHSVGSPNIAAVSATTRPAPVGELDSPIGVTPIQTRHGRGLQSIGQESLEMRARHDVVVRARAALEHVECGLCPGDPRLQPLTVAGHHLMAGRCGPCGQYRPDVRESEARLLRDQDRRHPVQVRVGVAAAVTRAGRCQQSLRLPVSQHVCRQPEPSRHLAD